MEGKDAPGAILDIIIIGKTGKLPGGLICKADIILGRYVFEGAVGIAPGLPLDDGDVFAQLILLRFDHAHRLAIHKKSIIDRSGAGGVFPHSYTERRHRIHFFQILYDPAGLFQPSIDQLPGFLLWSHADPSPMRMGCTA